MFKVKHYKTGDIVIVYGVKQNSDSSTWFLTCWEGIWLWVDADSYVPVEE
jgi:ATP-dependent DNA ligase